MAMAAATINFQALPACRRCLLFPQNSGCGVHGHRRMPGHGLAEISCAWNRSRRCRTTACRSSSRESSNPLWLQMTSRIFDTQMASRRASSYSAFEAFWSLSMALISGVGCCSCSPPRSNSMAASACSTLVLFLSVILAPFCIVIRAPTYASASIIRTYIKKNH